MIIRRILAALRIGKQPRPTPELRFIWTDPVQEIAAEPATLDQLCDTLRPKDDEPQPAPELLATARLTGLPLVYDDRVPPGDVHCRPTPGAPPPPTRQQITDLMQALMAKEQPK